MNIAITGANGFLGTELVAVCQNIFDKVFAIVRSSHCSFNDNVETIVYDDINGKTNWEEKLRDLDVLVHTAARVHVLSERESDPIAAFREVNTKGTLVLAKAAASSGVKRFVFISSIKVHGEENENLEPFSENEHLYPVDPYGISKLEAEQQLIRIGKETGMEVVIIRPPLIYGPGVKANFRSMINWVQRSWPIPFGKVTTKRSFVSLDNMVDFVVCCAQHPRAAGEQFLISDQSDLSISQLLRMLGEAMEKKVFLFPIPIYVLKFTARILGRKDLATKLLGNLQVDSSKATRLLGWTPKVNVKQGLQKTVNH